MKILVKIQKLAESIKEAVARGDIEIEDRKNVVMNFTPTESEQKELPQLLQETLNAIEKAKAAAEKSNKDVLVGGLEEKLKELSQAADQAQDALNKDKRKKRNLRKQKKKQN